MAADVTVIGGGISGLACARAATAAGLSVRVLDRGRRVGGRLATRTLWGRPVDHGASYFVVGDSAPFEELVAGWQDGGLARRLYALSVRNTSRKAIAVPCICTG